MKKLSISLFLIFLFISVYAQNKKAYVAGNPSDFKKYGLKSGNIPEIWEDGIRTGGKEGTYEWWYFDAHLDDGSKMVIVFYTKPFTEIKKGLIPFISINIDKPDGTTIKKAHYGKVKEFSASKKKCDIIIGKNYFRGDLKNYEIHFDDPELNIDVKIQRTTESWRPKTGHFMYGNEGKYFAWLVPVPKGKADITYKYKGKTYTSTASCYHDHNFGNEHMLKLINHWYWSRAEIGPYNLIAAELISDKEFDSEPVVVFNISKNGKTIADNGEAVKLLRSYGKMQAIAKKPLSDKLKFVYETENSDIKYEYSLSRDKTIEEVKLLDALVKSKLKRGLAKMLTGFDGAYFRMSGNANLKVFKKDCLIEQYTSDKAVWELMYFGEPYE
ncbi:MAG: hypothetical protein DRI95_15115 [Bacteroidetes bacterium]|nr:MAG: hypothetical protein DRI95_15115 [Bacteroidota bacterium]